MGENLSLPKGNYCDMLHVRDNLVVTVILKTGFCHMVGGQIHPISITHPYQLALLAEQS